MSESPDSDLRIIPQAEAPLADDSTLGRVAGILLAAGESTRYGEENKLLELLDGDPVVRHAAETLTEAGLGAVMVVLGHEGEQVRQAVAGLGCHYVDNPDYEAGQSTSVVAGVQALFEGSLVPDAVLFALGDMPSVAPETIRRLVGAFNAGQGDALAAAYEGERGNPVLFDAEFLPQLAGVDGDRGARDVFLEADGAALVETGDPGVVADVDQPEDLAELQSQD